jgi:hypothetical protein
LPPTLNPTRTPDFVYGSMPAMLLFREDHAGNTPMRDERELRNKLMEHLEAALAITDELRDGTVGYLIEVAMDQARAGDIDRLREVR